MPNVGSVDVDAEIHGEKVPGQLQRILDRAGRQMDKGMSALAKRMGNNLSKSLKPALADLKNQFGSLGRSLIPESAHAAIRKWRERATREIDLFKDGLRRTTAESRENWRQIAPNMADFESTFPRLGAMMRQVGDEVRKQRGHVTALRNAWRGVIDPDTPIAVQGLAEGMSRLRPYLRRVGEEARLTGYAFGYVRDALKQNRTDTDAAIKRSSGHAAALRTITKASDGLSRSLTKQAGGWKSMSHNARQWTLIIGAIVAAMSQASVLGSALGGTIAALGAMFAGLAGAVAVGIAGFKGLYDESIQLSSGAAAAKQAFSDLGGALKELQGRITNAMFADMAGSISNLTDRLIPGISTAIENMASATGQALGRIFDSLSSDKAIGVFNEILEGSVPIIGSLTDAVIGFGGAFGNIIAASMPLAQTFAAAIGGVGLRFLEWSQSDAGRARIGEWLNTAAVIMPKVMELVAATGRALADLVTPQSILSTGQLLDALTRFMPVLSQILGVAGSLNIFGLLASALDTVGAALAPVLPLLQSVAYAVSSLVIAGLDKVAGWFREIGPGVQGALAPLTQIFTLIGDIANGIVPMNQGISQMGGLFSSFISGLASSIGSALPGIISSWAQTWSTMVTAVANALPQIIPAVVGALSTVATTIVSLIPTIVSAIASALPAVLQAGVQVFTGLVDAVLQVLPTVLSTLLGALPGIITTIIGMVPQILDAGLQLFTGLVQAVTTALPQVISALVSALPGILTAIIGMVPMLIESGITLFLGLVQSVTTAFPQIVGALVGAIPQIVAAVVGMVPQLVQAGITLFLGLVQALTTAIPQVIVALTNAIPQIITALVSALPMLISGALQLFLGLVQGLIQAIPQVVASLLGMLPTIISALIGMIPSLIVGAIQLFVGIALGLIEAIPVIIETLISLIPMLVETLIAATPQLIDAGIQLFMGLVEAIPQIAGELFGAVGDLLGGVWSIFTGQKPEAKEQGKGLMSSANEGMSGQKGALTSTADTLGSTVNSTLSGYQGKLQTTGSTLGSKANDGLYSYNGAFRSTGSTLGQTATDALAGKNSALTNAATTIGSNANSALASQAGAFNTTGSTLGQYATTGLSSNLGDMRSTADNLGTSVADGISSKSGAAQGAAKNLGQDVISGLKSTYAAGKSAGAELAHKMNAGLGSVEGSIRKTGSRLGSNAASGARGEAGQFYGIGQQMAAGMASGIYAGGYGVAAAARSIAANAAAAARAALDIRSPSRVFMQIGEYTGQGLADGIESMSKTVAKVSSGLADAAVRGMGSVGDSSYKPKVSASPVGLGYAALSESPWSAALATGGMGSTTNTNSKNITVEPGAIQILGSLDPRRTAIETVNELVERIA